MSGVTDDDTRFGSIYDAHRVALMAYCRRRLPHDAVDDVLADVFLTAWRRIDQIPSGSELVWLYGVARNVAANQQRSFIRRSRLRARVQSRRLDAAPDTAAVRIDEDHAVLDALATLSEPDQEVLRLRAWEELNSAEIGVVLGISTSAVDMRLSRARRRLERAMSSVGFNVNVADRRLVEKGLS